ncbi:MAG: FAD-dependent oxidoreductase, partial [Candidatus Promineifilaceae bacterium]
MTCSDYLYFYDALSPIVSLDSIDMDKAFRASRHDAGHLEEGDYINCPLNEAEYVSFTQSIVEAEQIALRGFEREDASFFEGCLPVEEIANRGVMAAA